MVRHDNHDHPNTPRARAACRRRQILSAQATTNKVCRKCDSDLYDASVTGPNPHGMCGPRYCHYALEN